MPHSGLSKYPSGSTSTRAQQRSVLAVTPAMQEVADANAQRMTDVALAGELAQVLTETLSSRQTGHNAVLIYETLERAAKWLLEGEDPTLRGVQQFPGSQADNFAGKIAVVQEFVTRVGNVRGVGRE
jgi:hypothetical protein